MKILLLQVVVFCWAWWACPPGPAAWRPPTMMALGALTVLATMWSSPAPRFPILLTTATLVMAALMRHRAEGRPA